MRTIRFLGVVGYVLGHHEMAEEAPVAIESGEYARLQGEVIAEEDIWLTWGKIYDLKGLEVTKVKNESYLGVQTLEEWTRDIALVHYYNDFCPCMWGCSDSTCLHCKDDERYPSWWWERKPFLYSPPSSREQSSWADAPAEADDGEAGEVARRPEPVWLGDGSESGADAEAVSSLPPTDWELEYRKCNQPLEDFSAVMTEPWPVTSATTEMTVTTQVSQVIESSKFQIVRSTSSEQRVTTHELGLDWVILSATNSLKLGFKFTRNPESEMERRVSVDPMGYIGNGVAFWPLTYNYDRTARVFSQVIAFKVLQRRITVYSNIDALLWYDTIVQHIRGHTYGDVALQNDLKETSLNGYYQLKGASWGPRWSGADWNSKYGALHRLNCGRPNEFNVCRSHYISGQRTVNRIYGTWAAAISPYVNGTIYDWDSKYEDEDPSKTDWDQRHNCRIRVQGTLKVPSELEQELLGRTTANQESDPLAATILDYHLLPPNTKIQDFDKTNYYKLY